MTTIVMIILALIPVISTVLLVVLFVSIKYRHDCDLEMFKTIRELFKIQDERLTILENRLTELDLKK